VGEARTKAGAVGEAGPAAPGIAAHLPGFHHRPGQVELATEIAATLAHGGIGLFEAGTGMGKSLAYLLPAAFASGAQARRILVSTKTKALQRQLAAHELPLVAAVMPPGWRWAVLMGRENYLCRRQLDETLKDAVEHLPHPDVALALAYLVGRARWGEVDLSALPFRATLVLPMLADLARELRSSSSTCLGRRCPARTRCHWRLARARAERAHVVCINHALLLSRASALPACDDVIIDEAHLLPDEAMSAYSEVVDWQLIESLQADLRGRYKQRSLAQRLQAAASEAASGQAKLLQAAAKQLAAQTAALPDLAATIAPALAAVAAAAAGPADRADGYTVSVWLTPGLREHPTWDAFATACASLGEGLQAIASACASAHDALPDAHRDWSLTLTLSDEASSAAALLAELPETAAGDEVTWGEIAAPNDRDTAAGTRRRRPAGPSRWRLTRAPLTPAAHLRTALWERLRSAVLTSATLTVTGSFAYYREMAGLPTGADVQARIFASPFDFRHQAVLVLERDQAPYVAADLPVRQAARLKSLTEITGGRLLALFTNKRDMERVATEVGEHAEQDGVVLLAQGLHGSAAALAEEFRTHPATVLLGVDSLWTGQDFPGDSLVCLVIAKLPFGRQDPLFQARRHAVQESGGDWFRSFYLPEAVLRFRQGFGRLIRTETDTGVIVVLDQRLSQKTYRREFLASLPDLPIVWAAPDEIASVVATHLERLAPDSRSRA
jgi:ATP-dependent DNA helicase DinG